MTRPYHLKPETRLKLIEGARKGGANSRKSEPPGTRRGGRRKNILAEGAEGIDKV